MCDFDVEMFTLDYQETPTSLVECLITIPPKRYQVCKVTECLTTSEACKLMSRDWFGVELSRKFPSLVAIRFEVTEKINVKQAKQPRSHEFSNWSRVLISYESMAENKKVICWRNINGDDFIGIELGNEGESMILGDFVMDFLIEALVGGRTGEFER